LGILTPAAYTPPARSQPQYYFPGHAKDLCLDKTLPALEIKKIAILDSARFCYKSVMAQIAEHGFRSMIDSLPSLARLEECPLLKFVECLTELLLGVHHDRPVPSHRLLQRLS